MLDATTAEQVYNTEKYQIMIPQSLCIIIKLSGHSSPGKSFLKSAQYSLGRGICKFLYSIFR